MKKKDKKSISDVIGNYIIGRESLELALAHIRVKMIELKVPLRLVEQS